MKLKPSVSMEQYKMTMLIKQNESEPPSASHIAGNVIQAVGSLV
jgi:hypothetical protein